MDSKIIQCDDKNVDADGTDMEDVVDAMDDTQSVIYLIEPSCHTSDCMLTGPDTPRPLIQPNHVTHVHCIYDLLDDSLVELITTSVLKLNYMWTRIGTDQNRTIYILDQLRTRLTQTINSTVKMQEKSFHLYCRKIRKLKRDIESMIPVLSGLIDEQRLNQLVNPSINDGELSPQKNPLNGNFRSQIDYLEKVFFNLNNEKQIHQQRFEKIKSELSSVLNNLGLSYSNVDDLKCIMGKSIGNYEEIECLTEVLKQYQPIFEQRQQYFKEKLNCIRAISKMVPLKVDSNIDSDVWIYSEQNQADLDKLYKECSEEADNVWKNLLRNFNILEQLYSYFPLESDVRHPHFIALEPLIDFDRPNISPFDRGTTTLADGLQSLQQEIEHYESLKTKQLPQLINSIRSKIETKLSDCLVSIENLKSDKRFQFLFLDEQKFDSTLLQLHEQELSRLNDYHKKYIGIFEPIQKFVECQAKLVEYGQILNDPASYNARRNFIQTKIKEKDAIQRTLTQMEQKIQSWITKESISTNETHIESIPFNLYNLQLEDISKKINLESRKQVIGGSNRKNQKTFSINRTNGNRTITKLPKIYTPDATPTGHMKQKQINLYGRYTHFQK